LLILVTAAVVNSGTVCRLRQF